MKRSILLTLLITVACTTASLAQDNEVTTDSKKTIFGLRMGFNYSSLFGGSLDSYDPRVALVRGIYFRIPVAEGIQIEPGFYYSLEGGETSYFDGEETFDQTLKLNYVDMPVLVVYQLGDGFFAFAGPEISVNVYNKLETEWDEIEPESVEGIKDIGLSAALGFGYEFENKLNLRAMYSRSLTSAFDTELTDGEANGTNLFQLALGYTF
ncbi:MAG: porin family protein [Cyclobacteriaceae bacterium]